MAKKMIIMIGLTHRAAVFHDKVGNTITPDMGRTPPRPHFGLFAAAATVPALRSAPWRRNGYYNTWW